MAKVTGTAAVNTIRGSVGSNTFQLWRPGVNILRTKPTSIHNPNSGFQRAVRIAMAMVSSAWFATLTQQQRNDWQTYALLQKQMGQGSHGTRAIIRGNTGSGRGYHVFVGMFLASIMSFGIHAIDPDPPLDELLPENNTDYAVSYTGAPDDDVDITWTESDQFTVPARTRIWLWNPTRVYHRQLLSSPLVGAEAANFTVARGANGFDVAFSTLATGTPLWFQMDVINESGQTSPPSALFQIVNLA